MEFPGTTVMTVMTSLKSEDAQKHANSPCNPEQGKSHILDDVLPIELNNRISVKASVLVRDKPKTQHTLRSIKISTSMVNRAHSFDHD